MYSEQGFEALIRPEYGQVCHALMVVSNCIPGSPQRHVSSAIERIRERALIVLTGSPSTRALRPQSPSSSTMRMNSSVTRTELLAFW